jgi:single-stranded-DNA-specific exonuclease
VKYRLINKPIKENYTKTLLRERGVEDVLTFLNPDFSFIQDPLGMDNMAAGAALLMSNIGPNKTILICADCDVDGYTSATIMYQYIKKLQPETEIKYFLHEGKQHGLEDLIIEIRNDDTDYDLIIMPDASSNDYEYHKELGERGIPVLVLDHHIVEEEIHENAVVINNQSSSNYRNKELTGAGVAW